MTVMLKRFLCIFIFTSSFYSYGAEAEKPLHILVYGDAGAGDHGQEKVARAMEKRHAAEPFSFAVSVGDNQYLPSSPVTMAKIFEIPYKTLIDSGVKFYQTIGNHDMEDNRLREHLAYSKKVDAVALGRGGWVLPSENYVIKDHHLRWIVINASLANGQVQFPDALGNFVREQLCEKTADWKVLSVHYPLWSTGYHGDNKILQDRLLPIFNNCPPHLVFSGHDHHAEAFEPWKGIPFLLVGNGHEVRPFAKASARQSVFRSPELGFAEVSVTKPEVSVSFRNLGGEEKYRTTVKRP